LSVFGKPYLCSRLGPFNRTDAKTGMNGVPANFQDSDATLLRRLRHGDSIAFSQLSRKHGPKILAVSRRILRNREDAEDNAQSTFMKAYSNCDQFHGRSQFSTWLVRVAINEALMRLRRRNASKEVSLGSDSENDEVLSPVRDISNVANQEREYIAKDLVDKLCTCLSPTLRNLFVLHSMEGWSQEELARVFGVPRRTIKSRIFRARSQLRQQLAKYNYSLPRKLRVQRRGPRSGFGDPINPLNDRYDTSGRFPLTGLPVG